MKSHFFHFSFSILGVSDFCLVLKLKKRKAQLEKILINIKNVEKEEEEEKVPPYVAPHAIIILT